MQRSEFFSNCLDDMESSEFKIAAERVIQMVTEAGGVVSFAHPIEMQKEYDIDFSEIAKMTKMLKNKGLAAIEVYHSAHGKFEIVEYEKIAKDCGLFVSGGSDYHGGYKDVKIGQLTAYGKVVDDKAITIIES